MARAAAPIAAALIDLALKQQAPLTLDRLHRLLFVVQGWHLAITSKRLFDEDFIARAEGPVLPEIDLEFALRGSFPFTEEDASDAMLDADDVAAQIVLRVWDYYGEAAEAEVDDIATRATSPWARARAGERLPTRKGETFETESDEAPPSETPSGEACSDPAPKSAGGSARQRVIPAESIRLHFLARATLGRHAIPNDLAARA